MIKIISKNKYVCEETLYLINLCNELNKQGMETRYYCPDGEFFNDKNIDSLLNFKPHTNDIVIVYDIQINKINDLYDMDLIINPPFIKKNKLKYKIKYLLDLKKRKLLNNLLYGNKKDYELILAVPSFDFSILEKSNMKLFDKIIVPSKSVSEKINNIEIEKVIIPYMIFNYKNSENKQEKTAGIVSAVCESACIEKAVEQAKKDGMKQINLYGYIKDAVYYNKVISDIIMSSDGYIKYCGNKPYNEIFSSITDLYDYSEFRASDFLEKICSDLNINFHSDKDNFQRESTFPDYKKLFYSSKDITNDFYKMLTLLKNKIPFAFTRYSDGEIFILQNKELILDTKFIKIGDKDIKGKGYSKEDHKHYDPKEHSFYQKKLVESYQFAKKNYIKGIACKCCVKKEDYDWQYNAQNGLNETDKTDNSNLTWANLLINSNYERFINEMYPVITNYKIVFVCNEKADLQPIPNIVKEFRVGYNAMINDYPQIQDMKNWISENNIEGHLFLFAASSFSELAIKELYEFNDKNTYMDIGTALNMFMKMRNDRGYLGEYWNGSFGNDLKRKCIW